MSNRARGNQLVYYTESDYKTIKDEMPALLDKVSEAIGCTVEPKTDEKNKVIAHIMDFIRRNKRKVYGGTAVDALLKMKGSKGIYSEHKRGDIEFYSPKPVEDCIDLCDILHKAGFAEVQGKEAEHEGTYKIFVSYHDFCDITYVPTLIYRKIRTMGPKEDPDNFLEGIQYVHPHFIHIDQLRIFVNPLGAAELRWEKTFSRACLLLKYYPFESFNADIDLPQISDKTAALVALVKDSFMVQPEIAESTMLFGFSSYMFFTGQLTKKFPERSRSMNIKKITVPFIEILSTSYTDTVIAAYAFIKANVEDVALLKVDEYNPFFQFLDYHTVILYNGEPIIKIYRTDNQCVPSIDANRGYKYVSYQHHNMALMMLRFRAFVEDNDVMRKNYSVMLSNSIRARNEYLRLTKASLLVETPFREFRVDCVGHHVSFKRQSFLRKKERKCKGKAQTFSYFPAPMANKTKEEYETFRKKVATFQFSNIAGNVINQPGKKFFAMSQTGDLNIRTTECVESDDDEVTESPPEQTETEQDTTTEDADQPDL